VFPSSTGGLFWYNSGRKSWDAARAYAGEDLEDIVPHDLRHWYASLMRAAGADVFAIQQQLRHRSPQVTMNTYVHLFDGEIDDVMSRLDEMARHKGGTDPDTGSKRK
jgi:integrase